MSSKRPRTSHGITSAKRPRNVRPSSPPPSVPRNDIREEIQSLAASRWRSESDKPTKAASGTDLSILVYRQYISISNAHGALSALDDQEYFQLYLWPEFCRLVEGFRLHSDTPDWVSLQPYVLSIAALFNYRQDHHPARASDLLELFDKRVHAVSALIEAFFRLELSSLTIRERCLRITFLCHAFRALDHASVKLALLPLLSLPVWIHLSEGSCEEQLQRFPYLRKLLSKLRRRAKQRDVGKGSPLSEIAMFALVGELEKEVARCALEPSEDSIAIISEVISLFSELLSQLRLRRTLLPVLSDRATLPLVQGLSLELGRDMTLYSTACFADWLRVLDLFVFYVTFPLDPATGASLSRDSVRADRARRLLALQRVSHAICERESLTSGHPLRKLPLASHSIVGSAEFLRSVFVDCEDHILKEIRTSLGLTGLLSPLSKSVDDKSMSDSIGLPNRNLMINAMASYCSVQEDALESFKTAPIMITEQDLWGPLGSNESRSTAALPVLNLDFLNLNDYLLRNFALFKWESSWTIREDLEEAIVRMQPSFDAKGAKFAGWAKMAAPLKSVTIADLGHQQLDSPALSHVNVHVEVDVSRLSGHIRREWGSLQKHDVIFLVKLQPPAGQTANQALSSRQTDDLNVLFSNCLVRGLIVNNPDEETGDNVDGKQRTFTDPIVRLSGSVDSLQFHYDSKGKMSDLEEVFNGFNIAVRRRSEVNNFFPVLSSLRELVLSGSQALPKWIEDILLGRSTLSSPDSGEENSSAEANECIDFADTFVSKEHIAVCFPSLKVNFIESEQTPEEVLEKVGYRITFKSGADKNSNGLDAEPYALQVKGHTASVFKVPKDTMFNETSFSMNQIDAIRSGMRSGLTLIAGPPGTGKTSCIVQIASNLYKSQSHERILMITRTNHALNDLVERILLRGVDPVRVLRLGQGESEISSEESLSKAGRIAALLQHRLRLLSEVAMLANSLDSTVSNDSNWSCQAASIFYKEVVQPELAKFTGTADQSWDDFPFRKFIDDLALKEEIGGSQKDKDQSNAAVHDLLVLEACNRVSGIFKELEALRFLEELHTSRQRGSYLVASHASIVAMTCVHAAMQRRDIISQSFTYDTLIMEEAAECLEIEAFLSLLLQRTTRLKRIVLVGDHKQLPPVVQDSVLKQRSNLGQSLFTRLVRLGNRVVQLDRQGRSRRSIADLFRWRYPQLVDLDFIRQRSSFSRANPGFLYTSQLIDTGELTSESQPLPHFYQNVAEAEYIAFTFLYMRMLGYPADRIAVLTTYNGQVQLLKEVISGRSAQFGNLGNPLVVSTVDKFQGRQADYVLLSAVRTKNLGHFRDLRRITVAVSRARLGLYMFGYLPLLSSSAEFKPVLSQLKGRHNLTLVADETFSGGTRQESDSSESCTSPVREVHSPADMATIVSHLHEVMWNT